MPVCLSVHDAAIRESKRQRLIPFPRVGKRQALIPFPRTGKRSEDSPSTRSRNEYEAYKLEGFENNRVPINSQKQQLQQRSQKQLDSSSNGSSSSKKQEQQELVQQQSRGQGSVIGSTNETNKV